MHRITRTVAAVTLAAGLAACQADRPGTAPAATVQDNAPPAAPAAAAPPGLPGTLSVLTFETGRPMTLVRGGTTTTFGLRYAPDILAQPSPDGRHLALISTPDAGNVVPGSLVVVDVGGGRHVLADHLRWGGGVAPAWTPDGTAIIHDGVRYEATGAQHAPAGLAADNAGYLVYSVSGTTRAYARTERSIDIAAADGSGARSVDVSKFAECEQAACPFAVQAVADGGNRVALGRGNTDPGHVTETVAVVDTRTGERVDLRAFDGLRHVWFTAGGGAIVADAKGLHLVDAAWKVTATFPAPAAGELFYTA